MVGSKTATDSLRTFYEDNLRPLEFGNAVADVILVPLLALNLIGVISIRGRYAPGILGVFAFIDVSSTAILLVAGYVGHGGPQVGCARCRGKMMPTVSFWTCEKCGARLLPPEPSESKVDSADRPAT